MLKHYINFCFGLFVYHNELALDGEPVKLTSYIAGQWVEGNAPGVVLDAVTGEPVCEVSSGGVDMAAAVTTPGMLAARRSGP